MIGSICGDVIGSVYERKNVKTKKFEFFTAGTRFTDDTVLTVALADSLINFKNIAENIWTYAVKYPNAGYGARFKEWMNAEDRAPYGSYGNGSAMRVSSIGFISRSLDEVLKKAKKSAEITHDHPDGIKGAQAISAAIFLARNGSSKSEIKSYIEKSFSYNLEFRLDEIRPNYKFDVSCEGTVPQAIVAFLESTDFEDSIRNAISIGGDSDTIACMTGGIAEAFYKKVPIELQNKVKSYLPVEFLRILDDFYKKCTV